MERLLPVVRPAAAGQSVYVMSYNICSAYPLINYSGRALGLAIRPALDSARGVHGPAEGSRPLRYRAPGEMSPSERYLNQAVLEDLRDQRPKVLVVLQHARDLPANGFRRLDYVGVFRPRPTHREPARQYQLVADLGDFMVYERIAEARRGRPLHPPSSRAPATSFRHGRRAACWSATVIGGLCSRCSPSSSARSSRRSPRKGRPSLQVTPESA